MRKMKNTGIPWIAEIPFNWNVTRIKYESELKGRIGWQGLTSEEYIEEGPYLITGINFYNGIINWESCFHVSKWRYDQDKSIHINEQDLLITKDGTVGKVAIALNCPDRVTLNSGVLLVKNISNSYLNKFLYYVIYSNEFKEWFNILNSGNTTILHLYQHDFENFIFALPPIEEQNIIINYLDEECGKIDKIYNDVEKQIEILFQYKRSIITETVTKGLNKNVVFKNTPISWALKIPEHWEYMPNKYVMKKIKKICSMHHEENIISLSMNGVIVRDLDAGGKMPTTFDGYQFVYPGNLLMCLFDYDVTPRCIGYINNYGITSPAYSQFKMLNNNQAKYYYYYYLMIDNTKELLHLAKNLRHSFTEEELGKIYTIVPPISEQEEIADFLDEKCEEIDSIIEDKKKQLEILEEYKKSLIYEYVTGKKEVPNE